MAYFQAFIFTASIPFFCVAVCHYNYPLSVLPTNSSKPIILSFLGLLNNYYDPAEKPLWPIDSLNGRPVSRYDRYGSPYNNLTRECLLKPLKALLDVVNARANILPDYQLQLHYYDGDIADIFLGQILSDFISFHHSAGKPYAQIYFGPKWSSCNTFYTSMPYSSTKKVQNFNQLSSFRSYSCNNTEFPTNFESVHNKLVLPNTVKSLGMLGYIKAMWKQVGIFADVQSSSGETWGSDAAKFSKILEDNGVSVVHVEVGNDYVEMFHRLAEKRARIILIATAFEICEDCAKLWCSSYVAGVRAPNFVLLLIGKVCYGCLINSHTDFSPGWLGPRCNASIQLQQMGIAIFSEQFSELYFVPDKTLSSWVIPAWNDILKDIDPILDGCILKKAIKIIVPALAAITTLNMTEQRLRRKYNLSLLEANRTFVSKLMAEAANEVSFGNTPSVYNYDSSHRSCMLQPLDQFTRNDGRLLATVLPFSGEKDLLNLSAHEIVYVKQPVWITPTGEKPKDLYEIAHFNGSHNWLVATIIFSAAVFISFCQIGLSIYIEQRMTTKRREFYTDRINNLVLILGSLILNVSVMVLMSGNEFYLREVCFFRPMLAIIGVSVINSMALFRIISLPEYAHTNRYISQKFRKSGQRFQLDQFEHTREIVLASLSRKITKRTLGFVSATLLLLLVWFASDLMVLRFSIENEDNPLFDDEIDSYYDVRVEWCESPSQIYWISGFATVHFVLLFFANIAPLSFNRNIKFIRKRFRPEIKFNRSIAANPLILMIFTAFAMLAVPQKPATIAYLQTAAFASCLLLLSVSTSVIVFSNSWIH